MCHAFILASYMVIVQKYQRDCQRDCQSAGASVARWCWQLEFSYET